MCQAALRAAAGWASPRSSCCWVCCCSNAALAATTAGAAAMEMRTNADELTGAMTRPLREVAAE